MKKIVLSILCSVFLASTLFANVPLASEDVMLQAFAWDSQSQTKWTLLDAQAAELAESFDLIWIPPASAAEYGGSMNMGYHPYKWSSLSSAWGNEAQLTSLIESIHAGGSKIIADIVINHRAGNSACGDFPTDDFGTYGQVTIPNSGICKDDEQAGSCSFGDHYDYNWNVSGDKWGGYGAARDLAHSKTEVQDAVKAYLKWLRYDIGFDGFRYDLVKGYHPNYTKEYNDTSNPYMTVGEYYQSNYDDLKDWVDGTSRSSMVFDFCFKQAVYSWGGGSNYSALSWSDGSTDRPAGLVHSADMRQYAVTFIDNHDTAEPHEGAWEFGGDWIKANAFLLSSPGIPCVFWKHWNNAVCKEHIKKMIIVRRSTGVNSNSDVRVTNKSGYYEAKATGSRSNFICRIGNSDDISGYTRYTYKSGVYAYYVPNGFDVEANLPRKVTVSLNVTPEGGLYNGGTTINMEATGDATPIKIYYTTDDSEPTSSSTLYTGSISIDSDTNIKAVAIDSEGNSSSIVNRSYITASRSITVQFKAPSSWTACNLWAWDDSETNLAGGSTWPGTAVMTLKPDGFYTYTLDDISTVSINLLFNNGATSSTMQTGDLSTETSVCWEAGSLSDGKYTATLTNECSLINAIGEQEIIDIQVSPNPTEGKISIVSEEEIRLVTVLDFASRDIFKTTTTEFNISNLPAGMYFLKIDFTNNQESVIKKIVKK